MVPFAALRVTPLNYRLTALPSYRLPPRSPVAT
jgi:hypothetical protein